MTDYDLDQILVVQDPDNFDWLDPDYEITTTRQLKRPKLHARREARRAFVNGLKRQALNELIPTLPPPDTDLYIIGNGAGAEVRSGINPLMFDFGSFLPHLVELLGNRACIAHVSTWTMNRNHAQTMLDMLADNRLAALTVLTDPYFQRREAAIANMLITGLSEHPGGQYLAFKNHVKAICITNNQQYVTITGSANLSAQPRCEQYVLTTAPDVYRFFVDEFFNAMQKGK